MKLFEAMSPIVFEIPGCEILWVRSWRTDCLMLRSCFEHVVFVVVPE